MHHYGSLFNINPSASNKKEEKEKAFLKLPPFIYQGIKRVELFLEPEFLRRGGDPSFHFLLNGLFCFRKKDQEFQNASKNSSW